MQNTCTNSTISLEKGERKCTARKWVNSAVTFPEHMNQKDQFQAEAQQQEAWEHQRNPTQIVNALDINRPQQLSSI